MGYFGVMLVRAWLQIAGQLLPSRRLKIITLSIGLVFIAVVCVLAARGAMSEGAVTTTFGLLLLAPIGLGVLALLWLALAAVFRWLRKSGRWLQADERRSNVIVALVVICLVAANWWMNSNTPWGRYERASREYDQFRQDPAAEVERLVKGGRDLASAKFFVGMRMKRLRDVRDRAGLEPSVRDSLAARAEREQRHLQGLLGER